MKNIFGIFFGGLKNTAIFINKKTMEGCFSENNNIGLYSEETLDDFNEAVEKYKELNYFNQTYSLIKKNGIYLSYERKYNPIISKRVYRFESYKEISYRWIVTDQEGKIINQIVLNKIIK